MSNIREVARIAGVSVATVSRTLSHPEKVSEASRKKVNEAIAKVNYRPNMLARNFRSARSYSMVIMIPDVTNPFFSKVIRSIEDQAQSNEYSVLLGDTQNSTEREEEYIKLVETRLSDGIIHLRPNLNDTHVTRTQDIPYINLCSAADTDAPSIRIDNNAAFYDVVNFLIKKNHRSIGLITGLPDDPQTISKTKGYREALDKAGITFDPELIAQGENSIWSGASAAKNILERNLENRPTAIACMNDEMAIGAIQTIHQQNLRVPEDISVTGFDDIIYARYNEPPLTTVSLPIEEMGSLAVDLLLKRINDEPLEKSDYIFPFELIERGSTAEAPQN